MCVFYRLWRITLTEILPKLSELPKNKQQIPKIPVKCLLTGSWHDVTILSFSSKQPYTNSSVDINDWMLFKYNAERRPIKISLVLCLQSLRFTSVQFSSRHLHDKQNNALWNDEESINTMNTDVYISFDVPEKVNVHRAEWGLSDADSHFFQTFLITFSLMTVLLTGNEWIEVLRYQIKLKQQI